MSQFLYRGVSVIDDDNNEGKLLPKGNQNTSMVYCGQKGAVLGAGYVLGSSEGNAVLAHQVESGMNNGCYVSTSKDISVAKKFATSGNFCSGYIYTLDESLFKKFGVVRYELPNSEFSGESEVSIRARDNGPIPQGVIIKKELVHPT